jgi:LPXTG-motif cell wall-anchored protein
MRRRTIAALALVFGLVPASSAAGDGGPVEASYDPAGATAPGAPVRYLALYGKRDTVLAKVRRAGGQVVRSLALGGEFAIPSVSVDGAGDGLSADGRTLVVVKPRVTYGRKRTVMTILDAQRLRVRRRLTLRGDFSYDALSPDGRVLYLVQYLSDDLTHYAVRAYDVRAARLRRDPIVDPREAGEEMRGYPLARLYGRGHRWAYTLYDGNGKKPFVHALDTVAGRARCIDLPMVRAMDVFDARLATRSGGRRVAVYQPHGPDLATIDTATLAASKPVADRPAARAPGSGTPAWPFAGLALLLAAGAAVALRRRRRRRPTAHTRTRQVGGSVQEGR